MCGFLGEVATTLLDTKQFHDLLDLSVNRGPDHQDIWRNDNCQIGFNRLSILDLSENGNQPVISPSGIFALVYNGEIYNYKELQEKYNIKEEELRSTSDTEILAHLAEKISIEALAGELNGMFSIALWHISEQKLYLIRDFAGIKPLFYGLHKEGIIFASQFDQVFKHSMFANRKLRPEIMKEFFGLGYMQSPNTIYENIFQLEPGQLIIWDYESKEIKEQKYYYEWSINPKHKDSDVQTRKEFSNCFNGVIKSQLQADVPVASFLSSGYDSTLVTAYSKKNKTDVKAFTFGVDDQEFDESEFAIEYAKVLSVDHVIEKSNSQDLVQIVEEHFKGMPEPFGDYSSVPTYLLTKKAREYAKVMLSGDGGDELFWGYPRFRKSLNQGKWFWLPRWSRKIIIPILRKLNKKLSSGLIVFSKFSDWILNKQLHFTDLDAFVPNQKFSDSLVKTYEFDERISKPHMLQYLKRNEFYGHMQRTLKKVDLMSMANSLEVRVPFLDKEMIKFSNSIIPQFTITHDRPKLILKADLYEFIDIDLVSKPKKGFSIPLESWLRNELRDDFIKTVIDTPFYGSEFISNNLLKTMVADFFDNKKRVNVWSLWHLYAWQKWAINNKLI